MKRLIINPDKVKVGDSVQFNWTEIVCSYVKRRLFRSNIVVLQLQETADESQSNDN